MTDEVEEAIKEAFLAGIEWSSEIFVRPPGSMAAAANIYARNAMDSLAALAQQKEGAALSDEVVERAARADADMAAALLEGLEALANTPMNIDFSVWSRFAFNVQMIAKRLRKAAITPAGGVDRTELIDAAVQALTEAEAILGGEYGDQYGALEARMFHLRCLLASPKGDTDHER